MKKKEKKKKIKIKPCPSSPAPRPGVPWHFCPPRLQWCCQSTATSSVVGVVGGHISSTDSAPPHRQALWCWACNPNAVLSLPSGRRLHGVPAAVRPGDHQGAAGAHQVPRRHRHRARPPRGERPRHPRSPRRAGGGSSLVDRPPVLHVCRRFATLHRSMSGDATEALALSVNLSFEVVPASNTETKNSVRISRAWWPSSL